MLSLSSWLISLPSPCHHLSGTGLRLLLAPIQSHSVLKEAAVCWVSCTVGPVWAERGHSAHGVSLPACPCCVGTSLSITLLSSPATMEVMESRKGLQRNLCPAQEQHQGGCHTWHRISDVPWANFSHQLLSFQTYSLGTNPVTNSGFQSIPEGFYSKRKLV